MTSKRIRRSAALALLTLASLHGAPYAQTAASTAVRTSAVADFSRCAKPVWPLEALRREEQGTVTLQFKIAADGRVEEAKVVNSSGFLLLDEAARSGISRCKFKPGTVDGKPQASTMRMQYVWTLDNAERDPLLQAAFAEARALAEGGDLQARLKLAEMYTNGKGVKRDAEQAHIWLKAAAGAGNAEAQYRLAGQYMRGQGVTADLAQGLHWMRESAGRGYALAAFALGQSHLAGRGVAQAVAWIRKATDADLPAAFPALAWLYETGRGVERSHADALALWRRGAELGDAMSQLQLGAVLFKSQSPRDHAEAVPLLERAVVKGSPRAQTLLGYAYRDGRGAAQDAVKACEWFRKAAAQSHAEAQYAMAKCHEDGAGVRKDEAEALRLYQLAANANSVPAIRRMLQAAERGELGLPVDVAAAAKWRERLPPGA